MSRPIRNTHPDVETIRSKRRRHELSPLDRWCCRLALVASSAIVGILDVVPPLAGLCGLVWGIVVWTAVSYPEEFSVSFRGLDGQDRWLAGMSLLLIACAFATV